MADRGSAAGNRKIGITETVTPVYVQWTGDLRVRFTDFLVNEIALDGKVLHLREAELGEAPKPVQEKPKEEVNTPKPPPQEEKEEILAEDVAVLVKLGGEDFAKDIVALYQKNDSAEEPKKATSVSLDDRSVRGQIHQQVRRIFKSKLETNTDESGAIVATLPPKRGQKRGRGRRERAGEDKPAGAGDYVHFTMFKYNRDTMDAVNQISRLLHIKPQAIGYAGTKDRRASTAQRCSLRHTRPHVLAALNKNLRGIVTGDYAWAQHPLHLGGLLGNGFVITIKKCRFIDKDEEKPLTERLELMRAGIEPALNHMAKHGWINYFGHQRFGTHETGTHDIGKLILGGKYEEAVNALLHYDPEIAAKAEAGEVPTEGHQRDDYARHHACMLFLTGKDPEKAIQILPRRYTAETCILRQLNRQGEQSRKDFVGAIVHITRGLRSMYLHAYQSYIWNFAASKRWTLHGLKVVKGDLIIDDSEPTSAAQQEDADGQEIMTADNEDDTSLKARPLSEEEATSGKYTIHDIVLPSPGHDVVYPDNEVGTFYKEFMAREENGGLDPYKMKRIKREFSLPGRYRKLMNRFLAPPSIEFRTYAHDTEQMHPTDLDILEAAKKEAKGPSTPEKDEAEPAAKKAKAENGEAVDRDVDMGDAQAVTPGEPDKIAAVFKFQLGRSAYATVTLRELMGDPLEEETLVKAE